MLEIIYLRSKIRDQSSGDRSSEDHLRINLPLDDVKENELVVAPLVDLPPPPDGGWGWVIVVASFMCNLILGMFI